MTAGNTFQIQNNIAPMLQLLKRVIQTATGNALKGSALEAYTQTRRIYACTCVDCAPDGMLFGFNAASDRKDSVGHLATVLVFESLCPVSLTVTVMFVCFFFIQI